MKINFNLDITPEEVTTLANAEIEVTRIREESHRDRDFEKEYAAVRKHIDENRQRVDEMMADFKRDLERVSFEIEKMKKG